MSVVMSTFYLQCNIFGLTAQNNRIRVLQSWTGASPLVFRVACDSKAQKQRLAARFALAPLPTQWPPELHFVLTGRSGCHYCWDPWLYCDDVCTEFHSLILTPSRSVSATTSSRLFVDEHALAGEFVADISVEDALSPRYALRGCACSNTQPRGHPLTAAARRLVPGLQIGQRHAGHQQRGRCTGL